MTNRRQVIKVIGAGAVAALAGCTSDNPGTKETPTGDSGDISGKDWEDVFSHSGKVPFEYVETDAGTYAQATLEAVNESEQMVTFAEVTVYAYDVEGTKVDDIELKSQDWKPGESRTYEIEAGPGAYNDIMAEYDRCEIAHIEFDA